MSLVYAILLGVIQGFTEFLPISSSGHLVIVQSLLPDFTQPGALFDVVLHLGTLFAVGVFFYQDIVKIQVKYIYLLVLATIPVVIIGFIFQEYIELLFISTKAVGVALVITGVMNLFVDKFKTKKSTPNTRDAIIMGIAQAVAIIPGISRSGSTIFAGVGREVKRKDAARFSFLLSIPAIFGASILQFSSHLNSNDIHIGFYILGFLSALASGVCAIRLTLKMLQKRNFKYFAYYCFFVGVLAFLI
jgi:undecaprenyl-diphosphatase